MRPTPNPRSLFFHKGSAGTGTSRKTGDQHDAAAGGLPSTDGGAWPPGQATAGTGSPGPTAGRGSQQGGAEHPGGTKRAERARGSTVSGSRSGLCTLDKTTAPKHLHGHGRFSPVRLFVIPWTVACQAPLSMEILQARILEWVAMPSSRGSSWPRDRTCLLCLLHWQVGFLLLASPGKHPPHPAPPRAL